MKLKPTTMNIAQTSRKHNFNEQQSSTFTRYSRQNSKKQFHLNILIETTQLHLLHHRIILHSKGLFPINNNSFIKVKHGTLFECISCSLLIKIQHQHCVFPAHRHSNCFSGHIHPVPAIIKQ